MRQRACGVQGRRRHSALCGRVWERPATAWQQLSSARLAPRPPALLPPAQILSSAPLLAAAGRLHGLMGTVATAIAPMTSLVLPRTDPASCEAALLFVWTLGLLVPSVWLASGGATPESRQRPVLALVDGWLSHLRFPGRPSLHATTTWCLHWALALVCVWVACCVAVGGGAP